MILSLWWIILPLAFNENDKIIWLTKFKWQILNDKKRRQQYEKLARPQCRCWSSQLWQPDSKPRTDFANPSWARTSYPTWACDDFWFRWRRVRRTGQPLKSHAAWWTIKPWCRRGQSLYLSPTDWQWCRDWRGRCPCQGLWLCRAWRYAGFIFEWNWNALGISWR